VGCSPDAEKNTGYDRTNPRAVMTAITRLCTVAGLTRKGNIHNSGNSHSAHHAHRSPFRKFLKRMIRAKMLKNIYVRPKALRTPGTWPAAKAGSTIIERGAKVSTKPASIPKIALTKRTIQPYLS
jgi:hypothetical protein